MERIVYWIYIRSLITRGAVSCTICRSTSPLFQYILDEELARLITAPNKRPGGSIEEAQLLPNGLPGCKLGRRHILLHLSSDRFGYGKIDLGKDLTVEREKKGTR